MRPQSLVLAVVVVLLVALPGPASAQLPFYPTIFRPSSAEYRVLVTPHFRVIYQTGLEQEARRAASVLEASLPPTRRLVGVREDVFMPVVLNGFNDRSNGYVTPFPFKQEIETVSIKSNFLTPRYPSWLEQVSIHELTHAVHAEFEGGFGVGSLLRLFSEDNARALNLTAPSGIVEGLAVLRESRVHPEAGRLNLSLVEMQFRAAMQSRRPWTLSQVLEPPAYTYPFDRHYNGGGHLMAFLADRDSLRTFRRAQSLYYRLPFLGYGAALWYGAGVPPWRLRREFRAYVRQQEQAGQDSAASAAPPVFAGRRGEIYRRPRWLDDRTLTAYGSGYRLTPGIYRFDAATGERSTIGRHEITEDYFYSLSEDSTAILFSRYVDDPTVLVRSLAEAFRMDVRTGEITRLTRHGRVFAPVPAPGGGIWALRNDGAAMRWVRITAAGLDSVPGPSGAEIKAVLPAPDGRSAAVLVNAGGYQGLFRADLGAGTAPRLEPWIVFENAAVFDASWSRDGRYLLFSADLGGISNVYAYDLRDDRLLRLTDVPYGALEPSLSPDGRRLAFVNYEHQQYSLSVVPFEPERASVLDASLVAAGRELDWDAILNEAPPAGFETAGDVPYRALRYLAPRNLYPAVAVDDDPELDGDLGLRLGVGVQGADPLQRWAYAAEVFTQNGRLWGQAGLRTGRLFFQPGVAVYRRPLEVTDTDAGGVRLYEERGGLLELSVPLRLASDVYSTTALLSLEGRLGDLRPFSADAADQDPATGRLLLSPAAVLAYRMQQNVRDLIPNTGLVLQAELDAEAWRRVGERGTGFTGRAFGYLPLLKQINHGVRLDAGVHVRDGRPLLSLLDFVPRGFGDEILSEDGPLVRYGAEYVAPFAYPDRGMVLLPVYLSAVYGYSFAERMHDLGTAPVYARQTSLGAGIGVQARLFFLLDLDVRFGFAYRVEDGEWVGVGR